MKGYKDDIEKQTEENTDFRRVIYTGHNLQLVLMSIKPGDEIGAEVHDDRDQFFRIEAGEGEITVDDNVYRVKADDAVIVPQGARHNVKSVGTEPLKLYTIYGPPNTSTAPFTRPAPTRTRLTNISTARRPSKNQPVSENQAARGSGDLPRRRRCIEANLRKGA